MFRREFKTSKEKMVLKTKIWVFVLAANKVLGVRWNVGEETLGFQIKMSHKPVTRHGLLAALSSVYDPLGPEAPFLLKGRQIIHNLFRNNLNWDEPI